MKSFTYVSPKSIEECWNLSWNHWSVNPRSQIKGHRFFENDQKRTFTAQTKAGLFSWGETYCFTFQRLNANPNQTEIKVDISLAFGYGAQWYVPYKNIVKWCETMELTPIVFGKNEIIITYGLLGACCLLPMIGLFLIPLLL
jgi:hypothetical protein